MQTPACGGAYRACPYASRRFFCTTRSSASGGRRTAVQATITVERTQAFASPGRRRQGGARSPLRPTVPTRSDRDPWRSLDAREPIAITAERASFGESELRRERASARANTKRGSRSGTSGIQVTALHGRDPFRPTPGEVKRKRADEVRPDQPGDPSTCTGKNETRWIASSAASGRY